MDRPERIKLVRTLGADLARDSDFYTDLQAPIRWLVDTTAETTGQDERTRPAAAAMRAGLVLERSKQAKSI